MQKFLDDNRLPYELILDVDNLGCRTKRASKAFTKAQVKKAIETGTKPQCGAGRPGEFEVDCRFCHKEIGAPGVLRQHFIRKHAEAQQTRVQLDKDGDEYFCPVKGCTKKCRSPLTLKRHYYETGPHSVGELLQAGLPVWFYRGNTELVVDTTLNWLIKEGYVQHKRPRQ